MADILNDVMFVDTADNMAGITKTAFIAFVSSFTTIAKPIAVPVKMEDKVLIGTPHVLKAGEKVRKVFVMYEKSGIESPMVGSRKAMSWKPKLKLMYCGTDAQILAFVSGIMQGDLIAWATPMDGVGLIQIGTEELPASVVAGSVKTGEGPEGEKGVTFEIEAPSRQAWYIYTSPLPTAAV